ncbi:MAG: bifunctional UDP-sugar hydrolase/5'-nucleotidase, partial [Candidatus Riflebacteria bacterium]|nr:bifunctional UDP-sugar hydrolase/5'-nucleotidase [Candidatus Riflebacteria bacterium]
MNYRVSRVFKSLCFFVVLFSILSMGIAHSKPGIKKSEPVRLTILHTSDIHAHLMEFENQNNEIVGGYARIKKYKDALEAEGQSVLMLSSGDISQGTFFYRFFEGVPDVEYMNQTGYAAMTLGNHEFDKGQEILVEAIKNAKFPILGANIKFKRIPSLQNLIKPYTIVNTGKDNSIKVAIIGLVPENLTSVVQSVFVKDIDIKKAQNTVRALLPEIKAQKPDMILVLSHLGWEKELEVFEQFPEIDGILGGHTHLFIDPPAVTKGANGHRFMSQPGEFGQNVTRYDINIYKNSSFKIEVERAGLIKMDYKVENDPKISVEVQKLWKQIEGKVSEPVAETKVFLDGSRSNVRRIETNLGDLLCDSMAELTNADGAIMNGGGIRESIKEGTITTGDVLNVLPFDNYMVKLTLKGESLKKLFKQVNELNNTPGGFGGFLQISSAMRVDYNKTEPLMSFNQKEIDDNKLYTITTNDFLAEAGNGLSALKEAVNTETTGILGSDMFLRYLKQVKTVSPVIDGRIKTRPVSKVKLP